MVTEQIFNCKVTLLSRLLFTPHPHLSENHVQVFKAIPVYKQEIMIPPAYTLNPPPLSCLSPLPSICLINLYLGHITNNKIPDNATSLTNQSKNSYIFIFVMS